MAAAAATHAPVPIVGSPGQAFLHTMELCLGPSVFMLLLSFAVFCRKPPQTFVSCLQHFAAGIVLSAVATELLPAMSSQAHDPRNKGPATVATLIGFFLGVIMMVAVAHFCGEPEEEEEDDEEEAAAVVVENNGLTRQLSTTTAALPSSPAVRHHHRLLPEAVMQLSPTRGLHRSMSRGRKSLMQAYREAALETSSPIPIKGGSAWRHQHQQQQQQQQQPTPPPNEGTALLFRRSLTTPEGGGRGRGAGASSSMPIVSSSLSSSSEAAQRERREQLASKYDSVNGDEEEALMGPRRTRRSSSASSASSKGQINGGGGAAVVGNALVVGAGGVGGYKPVPWTLVVPVYVDSFMDGLLIGLSSVAGQSAGLIMSIALTIEMAFLGVTFSAGVNKVRPSLRYLLVTGAPLMILVGGAIGALAAAALSANPILQVGLIAFGVAALLYLVTEELLVEAHESGQGHDWRVDMMFFVGFIASILLEQTVQDQEMQHQQAAAAAAAAQH